MLPIGRVRALASSETRFARDYAARHRGLNIQQCVAAARAETGKSLSAQIKDIVRLARGDGKLKPYEYYYYRLYDDAAYSFEEKRRFLSGAVHPGVIQQCCDTHWWAAVDDKFLAYSLLESLGVPVPETQAVFAHDARRFGRLPRLSSADELTHFLKGRARYPLFVKSLDGLGSLGACRIEAREGDTLQLNGGERLAVDGFAAQLGCDKAYLLQSVLTPHKALRKYGDTASTVRVIVIIDNGTPEILHTIWKIPAGGNVADNAWRKGNMLAAVDADSGVIRRVVRGAGPKMEELASHPESGAPLVGDTLPDWQRLLDLVKGNAGVFAPIRYQSWDIALCDDGPVAVEVNTGSAFNVSQLAKGEGFLTDRYRTFLLSCGYKLKTRH